MSSVSLSKRQRAIVDFIAKAQRENGYLPSYREIGDAVGLSSVASVNYQLSQLQAKGYVSRTYAGQRAFKVKKSDIEIPGAPASFTSIAFETGRILGLEEAAKLLEETAEAWTRPATFSYPSELRKLAAEIRKITK